jgi:hypothetical protein
VHQGSLVRLGSLRAGAAAGRAVRGHGRPPWPSCPYPHPSRPKLQDRSGKVDAMLLGGVEGGRRPAVLPHLTLNPSARQKTPTPIRPPLNAPPGRSPPASPRSCVAESGGGGGVTLACQAKTHAHARTNACAHARMHSGSHARTWGAAVGAVKAREVQVQVLAPLPCPSLDRNAWQETCIP